MKKIVLIVIGLVVLAGVKAQSKEPDDLDIIQSAFGKDKKQIIDNYMNLSPDVAAKFWPVYDEYESKRRELVRTSLGTLAKYANNYGSIDNDLAESLSKDAFKNAKNIEKLHEKYFKKMKKAAGALNASKFMQMEAYLQKTLELSVLDDIPFIDELDGSKR